MDPVPGRLLVATPRILDPNFARTVVLVCVADDDGTMGLVMNRVADVDAAGALPDWQDRLASPPQVFIGGPVNLHGLIGLGRRSSRFEPHDWTEVEAGVGIVNLNEPPQRLLPHVTDLRIFAGFSGWDTGQLDAEIRNGDWFVVPSAPDDIFTAEPDGLWRRVLRRQGDRLAWFALYPDDPRDN